MASVTDDDALAEHALTQLQFDAGKPVMASVTIRPRDAHERVVSAPALPRIPVQSGAGDPSLADYAFVSVLGEGGMGRVHLAHQRSLAREVAIKTLKPDASLGALRALIREAQLTGLLEHPGVIPVHAFGLGGDDRPLLVMKRVAGVDFATLLADPAHAGWGGRDSNDERLIASLEIVMQVCQTVEFAHRRGVLHRDIKPENIMVGGLGEVYLLDWGVAISTSDAGKGTEIVGTLAYMAPEMTRGEPLDTRTDVYLLGATLHEVLTGEPPHGNGTLREVLVSALSSTPRAYDETVPAELASLCRRAMHRERAARPASAQAFRRELEGFLRHRGAHALSDAANERLQELTRVLDEAMDEPPADLAGAYRLGNEARFGFAQALREHAESVVARAGMRRTLEALIELELRQGHPETATALLREIEDAPAELGTRIEALRRRLAERSRNEERLRSIRRDLDPSVHARHRIIVFSAFGAVLSLFAASSLLLSKRSTPRPTELLWTSVATLALFVIGHLVLRRRVQTNAFNRRGIGLLHLGIIGTVANRAIGLWLDMPTAGTLALDLVIGALMYAAGAITMLRAMWVCVSLLGGGAIVACLWPRHAVHAFEGGTIAGLVAVSVLLANHKERTLEESGAQGPSSDEPR
ncbi:MAG: serine/threonine protein kinase [Labilithrix sp.]|nr:serine/threonine protein kinase [Labilithrix sp.]